MQRISPPSLGPIQGYTTHNQVRIWLRGELHNPALRYFGVVQIAPAGGPWETPRYQKLVPHFDMTGVVACTGLQPDAAYRYRAGWFEAAATVELQQLPSAADLDWGNVPEYIFHTGTNDASQLRTFVVGSCRYLLKLRVLGLDIFDDRGDKTFRSILEQAAQTPRIDALLMMGDQVYADDLGFIKPDDTMAHFLDRYHDVFGQEYLRRLMSQTPTYMMLDDHEIEDNWPQKATQRDRVLLYPKAIHAYQIYQASHSPLFGLDAQGYITGTPDRFWYTFRDGCVDCFVMDSRTERVWSDDPTKRSIITRVQMTALLTWLQADTAAGRVKLVVTSVPFFPDLKEENSDKWGGFLRERTQILDFIKQKRIRKVVFMSGDVHCSFTAELTCAQDPQFRVVSVVSSSFFWPYPHMRATSFQLTGALQVPKDHPNEYQVENATEVFSEDNFGRVTFKPTGISVSYFDRKGTLLSTLPAEHHF